MATISGHFSRSDNGVSAGSPRKKESLTIFYWTIRTPIHIITGCTDYLSLFGYHSDVTIGVTHTVTDCSGDFIASIPSGSGGFCVAAGDYQINGSYNICRWSDVVNREYKITPLTLLSHAGALYAGQTPQIDAFDTGGSTPPTWYIDPPPVGSVQETYSFYTNAFFADDSDPQPYLWGHSGVSDVSRNSGNDGTSVFFYARHNPLTSGSYVLNFAYGHIGKSQINVLVKKGTAYYRVNNASITIKDSCGASKTITGALTLWGDPTWPDWKLWNSITINAGIPPNCNYAANPNLTLVSYNSLNTDVTTQGTAIPSLPALQYFQNFNWTIILQDCGTPGPPPPDPPSRNPFIYQHGLGQLYKVAVQTSTGGVIFWRSDFTVPPYNGWQNISAGTADADPKLTVDDRTDRVYVTFARAGDTWEIYSDDNGNTWGNVTTTISGGTHPTIETGNDGTIIRAAYVGVIGGPGIIKGTIQRPGDVSTSALVTFVDSTGTALVVADDNLHIAQEQSGAERWIGTWILNSDTAPSDWWSADADKAVTSGKMSWTRL